MNFPYLYTEQSMDSLDIEDIGNVCLNAINDNADEWYIRIDTDLGWTTIKQFGPLTVDVDAIGNSFYYSQNKFEYNEKSLRKTIDDFLNNGKRMVTQAFIIDKDDFNVRLRGLKDESR